MTEPKNIYTIIAKAGHGNTTVGHLFNNTKYESTPYNRPKEMEFVK